MHSYDALIVFHPQTTEEKRLAILKRFEKRITDGGGAIEKTDNWGLKRLNFRFQKHKNLREAFYVLLVFKGEGKTANLLRSALRLQEDVVRFMITRTILKAAAEPEEISFPAAPEEKPVGEPK
ncbi:MAG: 30S ribosomal protein S6 [Candidatus Margulisbacteria bacterium]|nr:30S ribosomal protein S6 [Candidatus Margulisiibacteriota bacterium]